MATATLTTVVDRAIGDPLTEPIWDDQLKDNINQIIGLRSRNLLTNGSFDVAQRGVGPFTASQAYAQDRWQLQAAAGVPIGMTVTQEASITDNSLGAAKVVLSGSGNQPMLTQKVEDFTQLRGKTVSFSCRVRQSVASAVKLRINDGVVVNTEGATSATTGSYVTLTVTRTLDAAATTLVVGINMGNNDGTYYFDNAMLVMGPAPTEYVPLHPQEDLARCQRYYEVHGGYSSTNMAVTGIATAGSQAFSAWVQFHVQKGGVPTVTKNGTWGVTNAGQPTVQNPNVNGYQIQALSSAAGTCNFFGNSTDDYISAEYNP